MIVRHPWPPVFDERSEVLILGTIPSPASLRAGFPYGHPQNCFWHVLSEVLGEEEPAPDPASRREFLLRSRVALWDVLRSCEIDGASDGSIRNPEFNDFREIMGSAPIRAIFATGKAATRLFNSGCAAGAGMEATYLPSTSPANRRMRSDPAFMERWSLVRRALEDKKEAV
ncbi:MAG: DNA-deoxyinosine glycosylase [Candidatus Methanoplasma sp.]|jgi:hypoxanthine-DNA glycosylase|nr:DNA-deoxyinosine glycosylase [Candidatus Methanoplasma sp.]